MEYLDFELEIGLGQGRDFPVEVMRSPAGERRATMRFPFDQLELENHLLRIQNALLQGGSTRRRIAAPTTQAVEDFGAALYDALLVGDIRTAFELSRHEADRHDKGLRIKLRIQDPTLAALPWEFLYDRAQDEFVALSTHTPIVRYLDLPRAIQPLPVSPPLRILGLVASPTDLPPLNVERERQRVERALSDVQHRGLVELTWLEGGSWRDLQRAMRHGPWHILHFVGHGRFDSNLDEGCLAFVGEFGETDELTASQIGRLLADHRSLRLVMLNACEGARGGNRDIFSGTAATLVRRGIPAVVAMQYEITDRAAIEFARTFYDSIAEEMPLDTAVAEARKTVSVEIDDTVEWATPVLFMRSPDGVLFKVTEREGARPTQTVVLPALPPEPPPAVPKSTSSHGPEPVATAEVMRSAEPGAPIDPSPGPATPPIEHPSSTVASPPASAVPVAPSPAPVAAALTPTETVAPAPAPSPAATSADPDEPKSAEENQSLSFTVQGIDGEMLVSRDWVGIRRRPVDKRRRDRLESIARLSAIHFEAASSPTSHGYIQLCFVDEDQRQLSFFAVAASAEAITFNQRQQAQFVSAREWLTYYMGQAHGI